MIANFPQGFWANRDQTGIADPTPVLIVGMPRSGTSLVEQILASHPRVCGAGERGELQQIIQDLPERLGTGPYPACLATLHPELIERLAAGYLQALRRLSPDASFITDKMPGNYLRLGLAALLLPAARVIHCRRDPLDTCLSCFFQDFAHGLGFTYDLVSLGRAYSGYARLMRHWEAALPLQILTVDYEALVLDTERQVRRLLDFLALPWDPACLEFHRYQRLVRTASFWQVRQPIGRSAIGRWRRYSEQLAPLIEALGTSDTLGPRQKTIGENAAVASSRIRRCSHRRTAPAATDGVEAGKNRLASPHMNFVEIAVLEHLI